MITSSNGNTFRVFYLRDWSRSVTPEWFVVQRRDVPRALTKQRCMKRINDKIHPKSPPNLATSRTCLHCDVTHLSLTTGVVALHIPSWMIEVREERRQARKIVWPVNAGRVICRYQNNLCGIINHHRHIRYCFFGCISCGFKHTRNKPYRHWRQDGGWHVLPIVTHTTAWRRELLLYTSRRQGQPLQFRAKNPRSHVIIDFIIYSRILHNIVALKKLIDFCYKVISACPHP